MKKKFIFSAVALLATCCLSLQAKNNKAQYVPNGFWDNWNVSLAGGIQFVSDYSANKSTGVAPAVHIGVGKWFNPFIGTRINYVGPQWNCHNEKFSNHTAAIDVLWNWSNQFGGYKPGRVYEAAPYFRAAYHNGKTGRELAEGFGLMNYFNLSEHWAISVDLNFNYVNGRQVGCSYGDVATNGGAYLGLVWKIGKSTWTPGNEVISAADFATVQSALEAANKSVAELTQSNNALKENEKNLNAEIARVKALLSKAEQEGNFDSVLNNILAEYVPVCHFPIGKSTLTAQEAEHLSFYANLIAKSKGISFAVVGSADPGTGSVKTNKKLRADRAKVVYDFLTKNGVSVDKINIVSDPKCDTRVKNVQLCRAGLVKVIK